jgi:hypothetical protein
MQPKYQTAFGTNPRPSEGVLRSFPEKTKKPEILWLSGGSNRVLNHPTLLQEKDFK